MNITMKTLFSLAVLTLASPLYASEHNKSAADEQANSQAKALFESNCMACHQPHKGGKGKHSEGKADAGKKAHGEGGHPKRLAPPMAMVKKHYLQSYPDREEFIEKVSAWVKAPDAKTAKLHHALDKFGVMPALAIDEASREQIAGYIYDILPSGHGKKEGCKKGGKH